MHTKHNTHKANKAHNIPNSRCNRPQVVLDPQLPVPHSLAAQPWVIHRDVSKITLKSLFAAFTQPTTSTAPTLASGRKPPGQCPLPSRIPRASSDTKFCVLCFGSGCNRCLVFCVSLRPLVTRNNVIVYGDRRGSSLSAESIGKYL
jgi:hypothetical protein